MNQMKVEKDFDCLEFKKQAQERISSELQNLTPTEQTEYLRQKAESSLLGSWWKSVKNQTRSSTVESF